MKNWTDEELVNALRQRLETDRRAFNDLAAVTRKLEEVNQRLQESEALKSHFLSNIRNEITNPLTAIIGLAGALAAGQGGERAAEFSALIYAEADGLDGQLQNIFMAAELESGAAVPEWTQVDIAGVLASLCSRIDYRCREQGVTLRFQRAGDLQFVTDQQKLALIVGNLLANAVEFSPAGAEAVLSAEVDEGELRILVTDQGPGIAPENRERVFDRFFQLDQGPAKRHRGHGLGLSLARSLAELLGGTLVLKSAPAAGCQFALALPAPAVGVPVTDLGSAGNLFLFDQPQSF